MTKKLISVVALCIGAAMMFSCQQAEEPGLEQGQAPETRAYGDKTPKVAVYVETNDVNPLNCGDYTLPNGKAFFDIVELFASNIHKRTVGGVVQPTLYLNDKMTNLLENGGYLTYVKPLQDKGIKVLLTVLGDHQGIGVASMNPTQTTQFARILAEAVRRYNLDGIGFDDEYADANNIAGSYNSIITKLHALLPADKLITVFEWGSFDDIQADGKACVDYAYHGYFGAYRASSEMGLGRDRWAPVALNFSYGYDLQIVMQQAANAKNGGYGAMMCFNIRRSSWSDPTNVLTALASGAGYGVPVTRTGGDRPQDWTFVPSGYTITVDDVDPSIP